MSSPNKRSFHVAVLVFPFGSHPISLLNLVRKLALAAPQVQFSFLSTAKSNTSLLSSSPNLPPNFKAYSVQDGVPVDHHLSPNNPLEELTFFLKSSLPNFTAAIQNAVSDTNSDITCLLSDGFLAASSASVADNLKVPWIAAWVPCPASLSAHFYTNLIRQRCSTNTSNGKLDFIPGLSDMRISDLPDDVVVEDLDSSFLAKTLSQVGALLLQASSVLLNSYEELNPPALNRDLQSKFRNVLNVGFFTLALPLPPLPPSDSDPTGCLSWLDEQKPSSVAYIAFGTVTVPPENEIVALAEALEESGTPFLWSLKDHLRKALPSGFSERTVKQGKTVAWAPQREVLAHGSVGVFVTQCGTNSVYESVANGVPVIGRSFFADQHMTGRMVESVWKNGVKVEGGRFSKNGVIESLKLVLGEKSNEIRKRAQELKQLVFEADHGPNSSAVRDLQILMGLISTSS